ncbi:MAG: hypothetical protein IPN57_05180 [Ignavibacteria bacterium]|nr:hypothetical protein [Ignavibacteria bacterium]
MSAAEFHEDNFRLKMMLGCVLGIILGGVLGFLGQLGDVLSFVLAMFVASLFLLETCNPDRVGKSVIVIIAKGLFRIVVAILALTVFFGLLFGTAYLVGKLFALPTWGGYWERYPVTRDYLWESFVTLILLITLQWFFRDRDSPFKMYFLDISAFSWMFGIVGFVIAGIALTPFLAVIILLEILNVTLPIGILGAVIGGLLGGSCGVLLGLVAPFIYSVVFDNY